jgi:hypothetical protein
MKRLACLLLLAAACAGNSDADLDRLLSQATVDCGTLEYSNFGDSCPDAAAAIACFNSATQPHVEVVFTTIEGDPIYEHFFIDAEAPVLIRDTREDDFGAQEITRTTCASVELDEFESGCARLRCAE